MTGMVRARSSFALWMMCMDACPSGLLRFQMTENVRDRFIARSLRTITLSSQQSLQKVGLCTVAGHWYYRMRLPVVVVPKNLARFQMLGLRRCDECGGSIFGEGIEVYGSKLAGRARKQGEREVRIMSCKEGQRNKRSKLRLAIKKFECSLIVTSRDSGRMNSGWYWSERTAPMRILLNLTITLRRTIQRTGQAPSSGTGESSPVVQDAQYRICHHCAVGFLVGAPRLLLNLGPCIHHVLIGSRTAGQRPADPTAPSLQPRAKRSERLSGRLFPHRTTPLCVTRRSRPWCWGFETSFSDLWTLSIQPQLQAACAALHCGRARGIARDRSQENA
jgi:hypothetical protein